ncbi:uncharacterized protein DSM5745_08398 [Aspergillus mulundensis]|uniref:Mid2 domain-containing protein n=1 Tax=Aspergillus mulundensis TaxID=1810919 RepID=A0A3D8RA14_9EURO|nr:hypothetical protein DSM5745_08398 [Aspergillus mulundensis]RDW70887.1 hypothetical protein DSM5745_08398 [Aspergillus mulundensis]
MLSLSTTLTPLAALALLVRAQAQESGRTCYNPDRTTSPTAVPCTSATQTFCCGPDAICLSPGYCLSVSAQPYTLYRGSCTDSGWGDFCAYYCVNYRTATNAPIVSVGSNDDGRAIYCCGAGAQANQTDQTTSCENGDEPFVLEDGEMVFGRAALAGVGNSTVSDDDSGSGSTDANSSGTGGDGRGSSEGACSNNDVAIGAGVGVPLGVLALSAVCWALLERRKRTHAVMGPVGIGALGQAGGEGVSVQTQLFHVPPQQKGRPTELDGMGKARISEMMGSEGDNQLRGV